MKSFSLNVCGLGNPWIVHRLKNTLRHVHLHILFLMKTKVSVTMVEGVRRQCGFLHGIYVGFVGSKRGLCLGWCPKLTMTLHSYSQYHIDVDGFDKSEELTWRFKGYCGNLDERLWI